MKDYAHSLGVMRDPYAWDVLNRAKLRAEIDAALFHLYGVRGVDVKYIMESFVIVKRKEIKKFGEYRTMRMILAIYDAMASAMEAGEPYVSPLDEELAADDR